MRLSLAAFVVQASSGDAPHCASGCIAGIIVASVVLVAAVAALAVIVLQNRREKQSGPAKGNNYERFRPELNGQASNAAHMQATSAPSFGPDPKLQRPFIQSVDEEPDGKQVELVTPN